MSKRDKRKRERGPLTPRRRPPDQVPEASDPWAELLAALADVRDRPGDPDAGDAEKPKNPDENGPL